MTSVSGANSAGVTPTKTQNDVKFNKVVLNPGVTADVFNEYCKNYVNSFHLKSSYALRVKILPVNTPLEGVAVFNDDLPFIEGMDSNKGYTSEGSADLMTKALLLDDRDTFHKIFQGLEKYFRVKNNEEYYGGNQDLYKWVLNENAQPVLRNGIPDLSSAPDADLIICSNLYRMAQKIQSDPTASIQDKRLANIYMNRAKSIAKSLVRNFFVDGGDTGFSYMAASFYERSQGIARVDYWNPAAYEDLLALLSNEPELSKEKIIVEKALQDLPAILKEVIDSRVMIEKVRILGRNISPLVTMNYEVRLPYRIATYIKDLVDGKKKDELGKLKDTALQILKIKHLTTDEKAKTLYEAMLSTLAFSLKYASEKNLISFTPKEKSLIKDFLVDSSSLVPKVDGYYATNLLLQASLFNLSLENKLSEFSKRYKRNVGGSNSWFFDNYAHHYAASSYIKDLQEEDGVPFLSESKNSIKEPSQYFSRASVGQMTRKLLEEKKGDMTNQELVRLANKNFSYGAFHSAQKLYYEYLFHTDVNQVLTSDSNSSLYRYSLGSPDPETVFMMRAVDAFKICMDTNAVTIDDQIAAFERILFRKDSNIDENKTLASLILENKGNLADQESVKKELRVLLEPYFRPVLSEHNKNPIDYADHSERLVAIIDDLSKLSFESTDESDLHDQVLKVLNKHNNNSNNVFIYPVLASLYIQKGEINKALTLMTKLINPSTSELAKNEYELWDVADFFGVRDLNQWTRKYANHPYITRFVLDSLKTVTRVLIQENNMVGLASTLEEILKVEEKLYNNELSGTEMKEYSYSESAIQEKLLKVDMHNFFNTLKGIDKKTVSSELYMAYGQILLEDAVMSSDKDKMISAIKNLFESLKSEFDNNNRTVIGDQILRSIIKAYNNAYDMGIDGKALHELGLPCYNCIVNFVFNGNISGDDPKEKTNLRLLKNVYENIRENDKNLIVGLELNLKLYSGYLAFNLANNSNEQQDKTKRFNELIIYLTEIKELRKDARGLGENEFLDVRINQLLANTYIAKGELYNGISLYDALIMLKDRLNGASVYNTVGGNIIVSGTLGREAYTSMIVVPKDNEVENILRIVAYNSDREAMVLEIILKANSEVSFDNNYVSITTEGKERKISLAEMEYGNFYRLKQNSNDIVSIEDDVTKEVLKLFNMKINSRQRLKGNVNLELIYESNPLLYGETIRDFLKLPLWREFSSVLKEHQSSYRSIFVKNFIEARSSMAESNVEAMLSTVEALIDSFDINSAEKLIKDTKELIKANFYYLSLMRLEVLEMKLNIGKVYMINDDMQMKGDNEQEKKKLIEAMGPERFSELLTTLSENLNYMHEKFTYGELDVVFDIILELRRYVLTVYFVKELREEYEKKGKLSEIEDFIKFFDALFLSKDTTDIIQSVNPNLQKVIERIVSAKDNLMNDSYLNRRSIREGMQYLRGLIYLSINDRIEKNFDSSSYDDEVKTLVKIFSVIDSLPNDTGKNEVLSELAKQLTSYLENDSYQRIVSEIRKSEAETNQQVKFLIDNFLKSKLSEKGVTNEQ